MVGLKDIGHIAGRGNLAIFDHPVPSLLPLTASPSAMPPSSLHVAIDVRLGPRPPLGSPSGRHLCS